MTKIPFNVSARTARLIGRENVANAEGAIIELVKNAHDADSSKCLIYFDMIFDGIPSRISYENINLFNDEEIIILKKVYTDNGKDFEITNQLSIALHRNEILKLLNIKNSIYIIDNGNGMSEKIIKEDWMTIGTSNKNTNILSDGGRVHTGAKGIGRFSLDRLGENCEMITTFKETGNTHLWKVDWKKFDKPKISITDVDAELLNINEFDYSIQLDELNLPFKILEEFKSGTFFKISGLRDMWDKSSIKKLFSSLRTLMSPMEVEFKVFLETRGLNEEFGEVTSNVCEDYDYKLVAKADEKGSVDLAIFRKEFDLEIMDNDLFDREKMQEKNFKKEDFESGVINYKTNFKKLLPGMKEDISSKIGPFEFVLYFMKRSFSGKDRDKYFYRDFQKSVRQEWLNTFGGIKMFRDNFRVRPYGEVNKSEFDWLDLGGRAAGSPAAPSSTSSGKWVVRPNQVAGLVKISRIKNVNFEDKSSREGIREVKEFQIFKNLLKGIISELELDRSSIFIELNNLNKEKNKFEAIIEAGSDIADSVTSDNENVDNDTVVMANAFKNLKKISEGQEEELKLLRVLASNGLIVSSFSHELRNIKASLIPNANIIKNKINAYQNQYEIIDNSLTNPLVLMGHHLGHLENIKNWLDFALDSIKKDKRSRKKIELNKFFQDLFLKWKSVLDVKSIKLNIPENIDNNKCFFTAYPMDFETIFINLIANTIDAFKRKDATGDREIDINFEEKEDCLSIIYKDSGPGLMEEIIPKKKIFDKLYSTKRNDNGEQIGTGLGLWIVKSTLQDYDATIDLKKVNKGFAVEMKIPLKKGDGIDKNEL